MVSRSTLSRQPGRRSISATASVVSTARTGCHRSIPLRLRHAPDWTRAPASVAFPNLDKTAPHGTLLAWIKPRSVDEFVAAFVGEDAALSARKDFPGRAPATRLCSSPDEARRWMEDQAAALDLPIKWMSEEPRG
jgi:hypothetical protein